MAAELQEGQEAKGSLVIYQHEESDERYHLHGRWGPEPTMGETVGVGEGCLSGQPGRGDSREGLEVGDGNL